MTDRLLFGASAEKIDMQQRQSERRELGVYAGSSNNRLYQDWSVGGATDPSDDWTREGATIANRSWWLYNNDAYTAAIVECLKYGTFGSDGLSFRSAYQEDDKREVSETEKNNRILINQSMDKAFCGNQFDAGGTLSKKTMSEMMFISYLVTGDSFAIREWQPNRPGQPYQATCWRLIDSARVTNKDFGYNTDTAFEGLELDKNGVPIAINVMSKFLTTVRGQQTRAWKRVPIWGPDGSRNVVHMKNVARPDALRGVGWLAPVMGLLKQITGVTEAHVVAKRIQASMGVIVEADDPVAAAAADRNGAVLTQGTKIVPGKVYYVSKGTAWKTLDFRYDGQEYEMFVSALFQAITARFQVPYEFVLQRLTKSNLASSRTALVQAYRTFTRSQEEVIHYVERPWVESVIREDVVRGRLNIKTDSWDDATAGTFQRPAKAFPDPLKEVQAAQAIVDMGGSRRGVFANLGLDFEEEIPMRAEDDALLEANDVQPVDILNGAAQQAQIDAAGQQAQQDAQDTADNQDENQQKPTKKKSKNDPKNQDPNA